MNRKITAFIATCCILASIGAAASIAYRVITQSAAGEEAAKTDFAVLTTLLSGVKTAGDLGDAGLRTRLSTHFSSNPALLVAEVYERGAGLRWRIPADSPYSRGANESENQLPPSTIRLSSTLASSTASSLSVEAVYVRITQLEVFTAFRDALIFLAGFLALASIVLAFASRPRRSVAADNSDEVEKKHVRRKGNDVDWDDLLKIDHSPSPDRRKTITKTDEMDDYEETSPERTGPVQEQKKESGIEDVSYDEGSFNSSMDKEIDSSFSDNRTRKENEDLFEIPDIDFDAKRGTVKPDSAASLVDTLPEPFADEDDWTKSIPSIPADISESTTSKSSVFNDRKESIEAFDAIEPEAAPASDSAVSRQGSIESRLQAEIERSAADKNDLSLLFIVYDDLTPAVPEYRSFADTVKQAILPDGVLLEHGTSGFAAILPGSDSQKALHTARNLFKRLDFLSGGDIDELQFLPLFLGLSSLSGRNVEAKTLIAEAEAALKHAREETDSHIVAFKPDPDKYRKYVQSNTK